jgi:hypothetical protein
MLLDPLRLPEDFDWPRLKSELEAWAFGLVSNQMFVPTGTVVEFAGETAPDGWVECDEAEYQISKYENLYNAIGDHYGGTSTTFKVPPSTPTTVGRIWIIKV